MSSPRQVAAGFTITGLLDGASRTRGRYPVSEIAVADIADHPANAAYSMDPAGIAELAESIREDGLTDLPLVRKVGDGSWQMVSGHRRKAARLVADFLESPPESPSAADLSLLREMALMTAPYAEAGAGAHKGRRRASGPKSSK